jgi:hypothetical protein
MAVKKAGVCIILLIIRSIGKIEKHWRIQFFKVGAV